MDRATGKARWSHSGGRNVCREGRGTRRVRIARETLYCLAPADGGCVEVETEGYVYGTPAVHEGRVVSVGCDGKLRLVNAADGKLARAVEIGGYVGASPAIHDGRAYFGTFGNQVIAVDLATGKRLWTYTPAEPGVPFLSSAATDGRTVVVGGRDKRVHALDAATAGRAGPGRGPARVDSSRDRGRRAFVGTSSGEIVAPTYIRGRRPGASIPGVDRRVAERGVRVGSWIGTVDGSCSLRSKDERYGT